MIALYYLATALLWLGSLGERIDDWAEVRLVRRRLAEAGDERLSGDELTRR